jgi:Tfp pilus assembly protein PilE
MNKILMLAIAGVSGVLVFASIVAYQFAEHQSAEQVVADLIDKQYLKEEYRDKHNVYLSEVSEECSQFTNSTPEYEECTENLMDKHGLLDSKYDEVRLEVIDEQMEAYRELIK